MDEQDEFNAWRVDHGLKKVRHNYKHKVRTFYISEEAYTGLKFLAERFKVEFGGVRSVSGFLEKVGLFELLVFDPKQKDEEKEVE